MEERRHHDLESGLEATRCVELNDVWETALVGGGIELEKWDFNGG